MEGTLNTDLIGDEPLEASVLSPVNVEFLGAYQVIAGYKRQGSSGTASSAVP